MWILNVQRYIISMHDHDVVIVESTSLQHLIRLHKHKVSARAWDSRDTLLLHARATHMCNVRLVPEQGNVESQ